VKKENELLKLELKKSEDARKELQQTIKETTEELKKETQNIHHNYNKIIRQKTEYIENLNTDQLKTLNILNFTSFEGAKVSLQLLKSQEKIQKSMKFY